MTVKTGQLLKPLKKLEGACVPTALTILTKKKTVLKVCTKHGWTEKAGMHDHQWKAACKELKIELEHLDKLKNWKVKGFLKFANQVFPKETFLITVHGHIFVIRNGVMIDPRYTKSGLYRTILGVWLVK